MKYVYDWDWKNNESFINLISIIYISKNKQGCVNSNLMVIVGSIKIIYMTWKMYFENIVQIKRSIKSRLITTSSKNLKNGHMTWYQTMIYAVYLFARCFHYNSCNWEILDDILIIILRGTYLISRLFNKN